MSCWGKTRQNKRRAVEPSGAQDCADVVLNLGQFKHQEAADL